MDEHVANEREAAPSNRANKEEDAVENQDGGGIPTPEALGRAALSPAAFQFSGVSTIPTMSYTAEPDLRNDFAVDDIHGVVGGKSILELLDLNGACRKRVETYRNGEMEQSKRQKAKDDMKGDPPGEKKEEVAADELAAEEEKVCDPLSAKEESAVPISGESGATKTSIEEGAEESASIVSHSVSTIRSSRSRKEIEGIRLSRGNVEEHIRRYSDNRTEKLRQAEGRKMKEEPIWGRKRNHEKPRKNRGTGGRSRTRGVVDRMAEKGRKKRREWAHLNPPVGPPMRVAMEGR